MPQSYVACYMHVIFSTKDRVESISPEWAPRLYEYIGGILRAHESVLLAAGGVADHVHLSLSLSKTLSISEALRLIKTNSSKWEHDTFPDQKHFAWQVGYGAFSVSRSNLDAVRAYIANQREHHRTRTFQEEFLAFLHRYGVPYDERYIWK